MPHEKRIRRPNDPIPSSQPESLELRKRREALENILNNIYQLGQLLLEVVKYDPSIQALIARNASVYIKRCVADEPSPLSHEKRTVEKVEALSELMNPQTDKKFDGFAAKRSRIYTTLFEQSVETAHQLSMVQEILGLIVKDIRGISPAATTKVSMRNPELLREEFRLLVSDLFTARQRYLGEQENPQHTINAIDTNLKTYLLKTANAT